MCTGTCVYLVSVKVCMCKCILGRSGSSLMMVTVAAAKGLIKTSSTGPRKSSNVLFGSGNTSLGERRTVTVATDWSGPKFTVSETST